MKNFKKIALFSALMALVLSCSKDDGGGSATINFEVIGVWDLTEVNISSAQDVNMDGTSSTNLVDEVDCISGTLLIDADLTWTFEQTGLFITPITNGEYNAQCSGTITASGTWLADATEIRFQGSSTLSSFRIVGQTLVNTIDEDLPGVKSFVYELRQ